MNRLGMAGAVLQTKMVLDYDLLWHSVDRDGWLYRSISRSCGHCLQLGDNKFQMCFEKTKSVENEFRVQVFLFILHKASWTFASPQIHGLGVVNKI